MTETTQMQSTNLQHSISRSIYSCVLTPCKYRSIIQYWNRGKLKYLWDIRILCATEQNQKSKCEQHNINFSEIKIRNNTNAAHKFTTLNLKSNISMRTYTCGISVKGTRIKSAWTSAYIHSTSLYSNDILTLIKFMRDMRMW